MSVVLTRFTRADCVALHGSQSTFHSLKFISSSSMIIINIHCICGCIFYFIQANKTQQQTCRSVEEDEEVITSRTSTCFIQCSYIPVGVQSNKHQQMPRKYSGNYMESLKVTGEIQPIFANLNVQLSRCFTDLVSSCGINPPCLFFNVSTSVSTHDLSNTSVQRARLYCLRSRQHTVYGYIKAAENRDRIN